MLRRRDDPVTIKVDTMVRETERAWLFAIDGDEVWIAKSQGVLDEANSEVTVPEWLADEKGLA